MMRRSACLCALLLLLSMILEPMTVLAREDYPFPDVDENAEYAQAVLELYNSGILVGDDKGNYNPDDFITRAEAATLVIRLLELEEEALTVTDSGFTDVVTGHYGWAAGYVGKAAELGIIDGVGNGKYQPEKTLTVEAMAKLMVCAWGYGDQGMEAGGWPAGYVSVAREMGLLDSYTGATSAPAPRSLVAQMAYQTQSYPRAEEQGGYGDEEEDGGNGA